MATKKTKPRKEKTSDRSAPTGQRKSEKIAVAGFQPATRTYVRWTAAQIRSAEVSADSGNLRQAANLCDWIMADDRVSGTLDTRVQSLLGLDPIFESSGDRRRSAKVVKALELEEDWWASYKEPEIARMMAWGIVMGLAPMRHRWRTAPGHKNRILPLPEFWHPQHLRYDYPTRRWMMKVESTPGMALEEELIPGAGEWILHTPHGETRPWANGAWRGLAPMVLLKHLAIQDWMVHSEKASVLALTQMPGIISLGEGPVGSGTSNEREREELAQYIYERGREAVVLLPPGFDLKLVEATANTEHLYSSQIRMADTAIAIAIRGGNLTTEVQSGSRAAAESQERLGDEVKRRFDGQSLTSTIHDQSLIYWAEYNFGSQDLAPWPVFPTGPKKDIQAKASSLQAVANAGIALQKLGYTDAIDPVKWAEDFEFHYLLKDNYKFTPSVVLEQEATRASIEQGKAKAAEDGDQAKVSPISPDTFA